MYIRTAFRLFICAIALSAAFSTHAQDLDNASFSGRVTDANGLSVVGATVTATATETGLTRTVNTDDDGRYLLLSLPPGPYVIKATAPGFADKDSAIIPTIAGQRVQLDIRLALGDIRVETTVTADDEDVPMVDITRTVVGATLTEREIEEIPNNTRNPLDLVLTLGGVGEEALSVSDLAEDRSSNHRTTPLEQGNFTISGGASYSNNITIDGFDNNDDRSARDRFQPSTEILKEVQVIRNQFSAEYGRASGGRVNLSIRGGTNKYRGRAFMFFRDDSLNANSWYNNSRGIERLPLTEYNPGFTLGGPVRLPFYDGRNRTFFSAAWEKNRLEDTTFLNTYIPVTANPRFTLPTPTESTTFCDNASPAACTGPTPTSGLISPYKLLFPTPNDGDVIVARIDHRITSNNSLRFGWQYGRRVNRRTPGTNSLTRIENALQARRINTDAFNFLDTHTFGSRTINEFGFQWSRYEPSFESDDPGASVVIVGYRNPETNSVQSLVAGNSTASTLQNFSDSRNETRYQIKNAVTHVSGPHTMKMGFDVQRVDSKARATGDATGTFNFNSVLNYSNNVISRYRQNFGTASDVTNTYWGAFFNDEVRLRQNLTLSFGLRYERETAVSDNDNFGPRLGIAWSPFKGNKGVIRFGAARVYNRVLLRTVGDFIQNSLGTLAQFDTNLIPTTTGTGTLNPRTQILASIAQNFPNGFTSIDQLRQAISSAQCGPAGSPVPCSSSFGFRQNTGSSGNPLRTISPDLKIPESYQFNIGFEREVKKGWTFEANYTYNKTVHLWREYNINLPVLPAGFADYTEYLLANTFTFTNVNGTTRTYRFGLGPTTDATGVATTLGGTTACSTTTNVTCWVNLNTTSSSTTQPNTNAGDGVSANSIGGAIGIARSALQSLRPDPSVDGMEQVGSIGNSMYNGLVLQFRRRFMQFGGGFGGSFRVSYTLSRMMDDGLNNTTNAEVNGDFRSEWARARQDRLHRLAFFTTVDTPRWLGKLRLTPVVRYGSSAPFNLGYGIDRNLNDTSTDRILFSGNLSDLKWRRPGTPTPETLISQFSLQPIGSRGGNLPRNAGIGPGLFIFDVNISRQWQYERFRIRPNLEIGNVMNKTVFSYGSEFTDAFGPNASQAVKDRFLVPTRTFRQRQMRIGLRFEF
jgi:hypothetical protein